MNVTYVATNWDRLTPKLEEAIVDTLYMVVSTLIIAGIIGLGLGVLLYTTRSRGILSNKSLYSLLNVVVNLIRPIPFIILLAALGPVTRGVVGTTIGTNAAMFVMIVAASFGIARIVEQNLVSIDPALGPLVLGYTFAFIAVVDMSAMAGYVGGGGLGNFAITYGYQAFDWNVTWVATAVIIVIVQVAQLFGNWLSKKIMRR